MKVLYALPFLLCATLLVGCASTPENSDHSDTGDGLDTSTDAQSDVADGQDTPETSDSGNDDTLDSNEGGDTDTDGASYDPTPWLQEPGDCQGAERFGPASTKSFSKPDNPDTNDRHTKESFLSAVGTDTLQAFSIKADNKHEPISDTNNTTIYGDPGEDAVFHIAILNNYDDLSSFQISVTAMVDYTPVEATYIRLSDDRQDELERFDNVTGMEIQADRKVEIIDIRIPASELEAGRMNEISIGFESHTVQRSPVSQLSRFSLFYGGWERPDKPCAHPPQDMDALPPEQKMQHIFTSRPAFAFFGEFEDALEFRKRRQLEPGETIRIYASLRSSHSPKDMVMVPVLAGKPLGPIWRGKQSLHDEPRSYRDIDMRRYIDVSMPEEPGVYNFKIWTWPDPYEIRNMPDGNENPDVTTDYTFGGSNHLTFEVIE
jgi:hypothetical protein